MTQTDQSAGTVHDRQGCEGTHSGMCWIICMRLTGATLMRIYGVTANVTGGNVWATLPESWICDMEHATYYMPTSRRDLTENERASQSTWSQTASRV